MLLVPTPERYPHVRVNVALSGASYTIAWDWNERDGTWAFSIDDPSGEPLLAGVRVVLNVDLLQWAPAGDNRPPYAMIVLDPADLGRHPGFDNFGTEIKVVYTEPDEQE